jgi:hypothetical protein
MTNEIERRYLTIDENTPPHIECIERLTREVALLSGRVDLTLRLLGRIVAQIDPSFLDDPNDPEVRRKSDLIGAEAIKKMKFEALSQAAHDPEQFDRLTRYFKDVP